jgi:hypothetical protein
MTRQACPDMTTPERSAEEASAEFLSEQEVLSGTARSRGQYWKEGPGFLAVSIPVNEI